MVKEQKRPIAVKKKDLDMWGCPVCGHPGSIDESRGRSGLWHCQDPDCDYRCIALFGKAKKSCIDIDFLGAAILPKLQPHPCKGIPARDKISVEERFKRLGLTEVT